MSNIFIFREPRTGSTAFTQFLIKKLNKKDIFFDREKHNISILNDVSNSIIHTHDFNLLNNLNFFPNPILIRTTRKNKVDQFISYYIFSRMISATPPHLRSVISKNDALQKIQPIIIYEKQIKTWADNVIKDELSWCNIAKNYSNTIIYYEDWVDSTIDIPILNLTNCNVSNEADEKKLPEYKKELIINYDMVCKWVNKHINKTRHVD